MVSKNFTFAVTEENRHISVYCSDSEAQSFQKTMSKSGVQRNKHLFSAFLLYSVQVWVHKSLKLVIKMACDRFLLFNLQKNWCKVSSFDAHFSRLTYFQTHNAPSTGCRHALTYQLLYMNSTSPLNYFSEISLLGWAIIHKYRPTITVQQSNCLVMYKTTRFCLAQYSLHSNFMVLMMLSLVQTC